MFFTLSLQYKICYELKLCFPDLHEVLEETYAMIEKITKTSPGKLGKVKRAVLSPTDTDKIRYIKDKLNLFSQRTIFDIYVSKRVHTLPLR